MRNSAANLPSSFNFHSRGSSMYVPVQYAVEAPTSGSYLSFLPHESTQSTKPKKPRRRRTFSELSRDIVCPHADCGRVYASKHALNLHLRLKHSPPQGSGSGEGTQGSAGTGNSSSGSGSRASTTHTAHHYGGHHHSGASVQLQSRAAAPQHLSIKPEPQVALAASYLQHPHPATAACAVTAACMGSPEMPDSPRTPASVTTVTSSSADSLRDLSEMEELFAIPGSFCDDLDLQDLWASATGMAPPLLDALQWHALPPARAAAPLPAGHPYSITMLCNEVTLESLVQEHAAQLC